MCEKQPFRHRSVVRPVASASIGSRAAGIGTSTLGTSCWCQSGTAPAPSRSTAFNYAPGIETGKLTGATSRAEHANLSGRKRHGVCGSFPGYISALPDYLPGQSGAHSCRKRQAFKPPCAVKKTSSIALRGGLTPAARIAMLPGQAKAGRCIGTNSIALPARPRAIPQPAAPRVIRPGAPRCAPLRLPMG